MIVTATYLFGPAGLVIALWAIAGVLAWLAFPDRLRARKLSITWVIVLMTAGTLLGAWGDRLLIAHRSLTLQRHLTPHQVSALAVALANQGGHVAIHVGENDSEAMCYAADFESALHAALWSTPRPEYWHLTPELGGPGLVVYYRVPSARWTTFEKASKELGIQVEGYPAALPEGLDMILWVGKLS